HRWSSCVSRGILHSTRMIRRSTDHPCRVQYTTGYDTGVPNPSRGTAVTDPVPVRRTALEAQRLHNPHLIPAAPAPAAPTPAGTVPAAAGTGISGAGGVDQAAMGILAGQIAADVAEVVIRRLAQHFAPR